MTEGRIPQTLYAHIGGSATWGCNFPEDAALPGVKVLRAGMKFETPFGETVPMKLLEIMPEYTQNHENRYILDVNFHGWNGLSPYGDRMEERVFWVLKEAGVKYVVADGTVACINPLLDVGDVLIPSGFIDYTKRFSNISHFTDDIICMSDSVCPELKKNLGKNADMEFARVFKRGTYGVYEAPRLETKEEVLKFYNDHCDVIGHTMMPEAALARAIGACYAPIYYVNSYAEGIDGHPERDISEDYPVKTARVLLKTLADIDPARKKCGCSEKRVRLSQEIKSRIQYE